MNSQTFNLKVNSVNEKHVHCTLFMNNVMLGTLIFDIGEYQIFATTLLLGAQHTNNLLIDRSDDSVFKDWVHAKRKKEALTARIAETNNLSGD